MGSALLIVLVCVIHITSGLDASGHQSNTLLQSLTSSQNHSHVLDTLVRDSVEVVKDTMKKGHMDKAVECLVKGKDESCSVMSALNDMIKDVANGIKSRHPYLFHHPSPSNAHHNLEDQMLLEVQRSHKSTIQNMLSQTIIDQHVAVDLDESSSFLLWAFAWLMEVMDPTQFSYLGTQLRKLFSNVTGPENCVERVGVVDSHGRDCNFYENNISECFTDDSDSTFCPVDECCKCKNEMLRVTGLSLPATMTKWRAVREVFVTFEKWMEIWSKPNNGVERIGGVNSICYDWLPFIHKLYRKGSPSSEWSCVGGRSRRMSDIANIFTVSPDAILPLEELTQSVTQSEEAMRKHVERAFDRLIMSDQCDQANAVKCQDFTSTRKSFVDSFIKNPYLQGLESLRYRDTIQGHSFLIWKTRDDIFSYFCSQGPMLRLKYVFDMKDGLSPDSHVGSYVLPDDDLKMCWKIMESALATSIKSPISLMELIRVFLSVSVYALLAAAAIASTYRRFNDLGKINSSRVCSNTDGLFDSATMVAVVCTNEAWIGSYCFAKCKPHYGQHRDGVRRQMFNLCGGDGNWLIEPSVFKKVCYPVDSLQGRAVYV